MKNLIYTLSLFLASCIPLQPAPGGGASPGGSETPPPTNVGFEMRVREMQAENIPPWEWGESELFIAMGSLTSSNDSTYQFFPSTGDILLREGLPSDRVFMLYRGMLQNREAVVVNVSLIETDCHETNRLQVAQALVPKIAEFKEDDTSGNIMVQGVQQQYINTLIQAARLAITGFDVVFDQYCLLNKDDVLGAFIFHAQNENGRIRWNVECVETCEVATTASRTFSIRFTSRGIHMMMFELAPAG